MDQSRNIQAIVAVAADWAIGRGGGLLCHLPADLKHFKQVTMGHAIVMGRKTFQSFPHGALPGRQNIVLTRDSGWHAEGVTVAHSLEQALQAATTNDVFIIGGEQIYRQALPIVTTIHLTHIHARWDDADAYFPQLDPHEWRVTDIERHTADERNAHDYDFITLKRIS